MCEPIRRFGQTEYTRVLDAHRARQRQLTHAECAQVLRDHGANEQQAKNGAYIYLHHGEHVTSSRAGTREEYTRLLDEFGARDKQPIECIRYLEGLGFSVGQAKSAVHNYRSERGLIR